MAKYLCLKDLLDTIKLPLDLFTATAALAVRTDWSPGMYGIGLGRACEAVNKEHARNSLLPLDLTTLDKVVCLSTSSSCSACYSNCPQCTLHAHDRHTACYRFTTSWRRQRSKVGA